MPSRDEKLYLIDSFDFNELIRKLSFLGEFSFLPELKEGTYCSVRQKYHNISNGESGIMIAYYLRYNNKLNLVCDLEEMECNNKNNNNNSIDNKNSNRNDKSNVI